VQVLADIGQRDVDDRGVGEIEEADRGQQDEGELAPPGSEGTRVWRAASSSIASDMAAYPSSIDVHVDANIAATYGGWRPGHQHPLFRSVLPPLKKTRGSVNGMAAGRGYDSVARAVAG
jgi:hypothetical protein